ncbi:prenyltransferase/squalene oxidase repeat-containing protein [Paraliomyxa miuraensis]|uniref:hypothetical protein n=1 Tax=Paraliomyxa miuraensis TaxID=376150 RepID=UPI00225C0F14|nr:hypothetical protein [Paraliomyxa miuraensis]MCX4242472.1 hypothetical protein [Paraliomyxa miuraensis]
MGRGRDEVAGLRVVPSGSSVVMPPLDFERPLQLMQLAWKHGKSHFPCHTGRDRSLKGGTPVHAESFTAMVVADLLLDLPVDPQQRMLVREIQTMLERELGEEEDVFYFFKEHERLPADADCTAVGLSVLLRGGVSGQRIRERANRALDLILSNVSAEGVVETYFDPTGERTGIVDPVVCCNVLYLAFALGRGDEAQATLEYVKQVLEEEGYLEGTRYYHSPDTFLYFLGRVVHFFPKETEELLREQLEAAVKRRLGCSGHTLDVAQRAILCAWLEMEDGGELDRLRAMQEGDGFWPTDALFRYGRKKVFFGSRVMTAAFVMGALAAKQASAERRAAAGEDDAEEKEWDPWAEEEWSYQRRGPSFLSFR